MKMATTFSRMRSSALTFAFGLLYTRLSFLHEIVGQAFYGPSWAGRRHHVLPGTLDGLVLDIGCGEGRLLSQLDGGYASGIGIEPSVVMSHRAALKGVTVIRGSSQMLPIRDGSIRWVIATYPGPWILDARTWEEIARVIEPGGQVRILLRGDISRGRGSRLRRMILHVAYGSRTVSGNQLPEIGHACLEGEYEHIEDEWGVAIVWSGGRPLETQSL